MLNKLLEKAVKNGYQTSEDLPEDYSFGGRKRTGTMLAAAKDHDILAIMANEYAENPHSMSVERARQLLSEKTTIYHDRLGRPTIGSRLRDN
jgi:hypothetical protein